MKKRLPIIIIAVLVVVFAGLGFYSHQTVSYTHLTLPTT